MGDVRIRSHFKDVRAAPRPAVSNDNSSQATAEEGRSGRKCFGPAALQAKADSNLPMTADTALDF